MHFKLFNSTVLVFIDLFENIRPVNKPKTSFSLSLRYTYQLKHPWLYMYNDLMITFQYVYTVYRHVKRISTLQGFSKNCHVIIVTLHNT